MKIAILTTDRLPSSLFFSSFLLLRSHREIFIVLFISTDIRAFIYTVFIYVEKKRKKTWLMRRKWYSETRCVYIQLAIHTLHLPPFFHFKKEYFLI